MLEGVQHWAAMHAQAETDTIHCFLKLCMACSSISWTKRPCSTPNRRQKSLGGKGTEAPDLPLARKGTPLQMLPLTGPSNRAPLKARTLQVAAFGGADGDTALDTASSHCAKGSYRLMLVGFGMMT